MRENRSSGSEGGVALTPPSLPLSQTRPCGLGRRRRRFDSASQATPGTAHEPEINAKPPRHEANSKAGNTEIQNGFTTGH
jgi:hypothetical protein